MKRMSDAQARFVARIWTTGEYRSSENDHVTAASVIRNGWMEPTGRTGRYGNFSDMAWTGYLPSKAGMAALAAYLTKSFG